MSRCSNWVAVALSLFTASQWGMTQSAPAASPDTARLQTCKGADDKGYFALALTPPIAAPPARNTSILVLVDTSASQGGEYRKQMIQTLGAMLATLGPSDGVKLMAVDVDATPLTQQFVGPASEDMRVALENLRRRVPLGATDMLKALNAASNSFAPGSTSRQSVIYIGDGMSTANLLGNADFGKLVSELASKKIAVSSYALGPQVDGELLAVLANQTGGHVLTDGADRDAGQTGQGLANIARAAVLWPEQSNWPESFKTVYPLKTPPLRMDRDTVIIGTGKPAGTEAISMTAQLDGKLVTLNWKVPTSKLDETNNYLVSLVKTAAIDGGATLPTVGSDGLLEARRMVTSNATNLIRLGQNALAMQNFPAAERMAQRALAMDPESNEAQTLAAAAHKNQTGAPQLAAPPLPVAPGVSGGAAAGADSDLLAQIPKGQGDQIDVVQQRIDLNTKILQADVKEALGKARKQMGSDPGSVENELRLMLDTVRSTQDVSADAKAQLIDQLQNTVREAGRQAVIFTEEKRRTEEAAAIRRERQALIDRVNRDDERVKQLMDRFESLMREGRYVEADQQVAAEARKLAPDSPTVRAASVFSQLKGAHEDQRRLYDQRCKAIVATLFEVEKSFVPFPDEPPIVYPSAEVWEELTIRRRKYASVDLHQSSAAERKINEQLKKTTKMEFNETRLDEVIGYLQELHGITISLDKTALEAINITGENLVTLNVQGVSLRSGLRLLLRGLDPTLTYSIQDEILIITTKEAAQEHMVTKVYPVGDLVVPITYDFAGSGGMGGFGGGAFGGGQGGGGGQMGGGQQGGFGGGGGGFGGGGGGFGGGGGQQGGGFGGGFGR
ncbi:MAG: VWA domain-containing protein [Planctomycetes bacterium]|nr:VWA domain-containing protein [Planctomycetota bacterium]